MNTITFEVNKGKTMVVATGKKGNVEKIDITDTDMEKDLLRLLTKISWKMKQERIFDAIKTSIINAT
jgi:hypothetical protein